jgi:hypothetical protein
MQRYQVLTSSELRMFRKLELLHSPDLTPVLCVKELGKLTAVPVKTGSSPQESKRGCAAITKP